MTTKSSRRNFLTATTATAAAGLWMSQPQIAKAKSVAADFRKLKFCLNTSTIKIGKHPVREQLKIAADAGYDGVELWLRDIEVFTKSGGKLSDLKKEIADLGLSLESAIAFGQWIANDDDQRQKGLDDCRRDMAVVKELGGSRIAAPPSGGTKGGLDLAAAADRYHALCDVGMDEGVVAQLELWGFSENLSTLAEVLYIAAAAKHPDACILLDVYHMYKGGDDFDAIGLVPGQMMHCLHMNDYPAQPPRPTIKDEHRVYPGDGVAPISKILRSLVAGGFDGALSLELFNRQYWEQPAEQVAATGLAKMRACVARAFA